MLSPSSPILGFIIRGFLVPIPSPVNLGIPWSIRIGIGSPLSTDFIVILNPQPSFGSIMAGYVTIIIRYLHHHYHHHLPPPPPSATSTTIYHLYHYRRPPPPPHNMVVTYVVA
nr:hypothetical protein [Tanacetum cinerariifolium]